MLSTWEIRYRPIAAGEVVFVERPVVSFLQSEDSASSLEFCHECLRRIGAEEKAETAAPLVPCPGCSRVAFWYFASFPYNYKIVQIINGGISAL